jgi:hypothetical protein
LLFAIAGSLDFAMIVIERSIATIYSKTYETIEQNGCVFIILTVLQVLLNHKIVID